MSETAPPLGELTVKEVSQLFALAESRLRYWAQTGFLGPSLRRGGRTFYTFGDLVSIKVAKGLLDDGLPLQTVRKSLEALRAQLPEGAQPLGALRVVVDGERLIVADADAPYEALTGQRVMSFTLAALAAEAQAVSALPTATEAPQKPARAAPPPAPRTAYTLFSAALAAHDAGDTSRAEAGYRAAIELDAQLAAAWSNLAVLAERRGDKAGARALVERAVALDPEQPEARYNLACLLADGGERELAAAHLRRVLELHPGFADAQHNLAALEAAQ